MTGQIQSDLLIPSIKIIYWPILGHPPTDDSRLPFATQQVATPLFQSAIPNQQ
jgi:hypothetical protein